MDMLDQLVHGASIVPQTVFFLFVEYSLDFVRWLTINIHKLQLSDRAKEK